MARAAEKRELRQRKREAAATRGDEAGDMDPALGDEAGEMDAALGEPEVAVEDTRGDAEEEA